MKKLDHLKLRSRLLEALRAGFRRHDFWEVQTPVRIAAPAPEEYIEAIRSESCFLRTSPELEMKILLAEGMERIYQIGPCFRAGEHGRRHREEFSMLEFYRAGCDYRELGEFTAALLAEAAAAVLGTTKVSWQGQEIDFAQVEWLAVEEAYRRYANCCTQEAEAAGMFDEWMVTRIEPQLGRGGLTFLYDYPAERASLARLCAADPRYAERWELYAGGMELANAFGELTDAAEQQARFAHSSALRAQSGMHPYPPPVEFFAALERGLPESAGCALGLDRLAMLLCDADDIAAVLTNP